jgi:hypothetical protein
MTRIEELNRIGPARPPGRRPKHQLRRAARRIEIAFLHPTGRVEAVEYRFGLNIGYVDIDDHLIDL